jgi:hypothetical protein
MPRADLHAARNALEPLMTRCAERDVNVKLTSRRSRETAGSRIVHTLHRDVDGVDGL